MADTRPLVVTLALDEGTQQRFDAERARLFPRGRTAVGAHVTLFHAVPGTELRAVVDDLGEFSRRSPFDVSVTGLMPLGRGVAYVLEAPELTGLHADLQRRWFDGLTAQDRQRLRPHVTVQNKVDPATARATLASLSEVFSPWTASARGFDLWRYVGGPWVHIERFAFGAT